MPARNICDTKNYDYLADMQVEILRVDLNGMADTDEYPDLKITVKPTTSICMLRSLQAFA